MAERSDEVGLKADHTIRARMIATVGGFGALLVLMCLLAPLAGTTQISLARA